MRCTACNNGLVRVPRSSPADPDVAPCSRCTGGIIAPDFECFVPGIPRPQGSKTRNANGSMREASKYVKEWRTSVQCEAERVLLARRIVPGSGRFGSVEVAPKSDALSGPLMLGVEFFFPRARKHMAACSTCRRLRIRRVRGVCDQVHDAEGLVVSDLAPTYKTNVPDLDKLIRAVQDSLKTAGVYKDDSHVVGYAGFPLTCKRYANPGEQPGAWIRIWRL